MSWIGIYCCRLCHYLGREQKGELTKKHKVVVQLFTAITL